MSLPALVAVAGLVAVAHLRPKGSATQLSEENKDRMIYLVKNGKISNARALAANLGLNRMDLSGAKLKYAYLAEEDLFDTDLTGAILTCAYLTRANLSGADLARADLSGADLREANLTGSDLSGANLDSANLYGANLNGAKLTGTNLREANIGGATGIDTGPSRQFIGLPVNYMVTRSPFVPGRTSLRRIP